MMKNKGKCGMTSFVSYSRTQYCSVPGLSPRFQSQVSVPGFSPRSQSQVSVPGFSPRFQSQVSVPGFPDCTTTHTAKCTVQRC